MKFTFQSDVDVALFNCTSVAWANQIKANATNTSQSYYDAALGHIEKVVTKQYASGVGEICVCAVSSEGEPHASALMVASHAWPKSDKAFLKLMDLYVEPELNMADRDPNAYELAWIAATAVVGALGLTYERFESNTLKIHTQFPLDSEFMTAVSMAIFQHEKFAQHFEVSAHRNWLVVTKKQKPE